MAISFSAVTDSSGTSTHTGSASPVACPAPASRVVNDVLLACAQDASASSSITTPSGWTLVEGPVQTGSTHSTWMYARYADGTSADDFSATITGPSQWLCDVIAYSGCDVSGSVLVSAIVAHANTANIPSAQDFTSASVSTSTAANCALVGLYTEDSVGTAHNWSGGSTNPNIGTPALRANVKELTQQQAMGIMDAFNASASTSYTMTGHLDASEVGNVIIVVLAPATGGPAPEPGYRFPYLIARPGRINVGPTALRLQRWQYMWGWEVLPDPQNIPSAPLMFSGRTVGPGVKRRQVRPRPNLFIDINSATSQLISGVARITAIVAPAITGVARVAITTTQTLAGVSRIQITSSQTITGTARITATTVRTVTGVARITATTSQAITGKARIQVTASQTVTGKARIQKTVAQTVSGLSRITVVQPRTIAGVGRVTAITARTLAGVGRISATTQRTITGVAKIQSAAPTPILMKALILDLDMAYVGTTVTASGDTIPLSIITSPPSGAPPSNVGLQIQVSGGIVTIWVWDGTTWRSF